MCATVTLVGTRFPPRVEGEHGACRAARRLGRGVFWLFAADGLLSLWFVRARVPETRGRTLEEIEEELGAPEAATV